MCCKLNEKTDYVAMEEMLKSNLQRSNEILLIFTAIDESRVAADKIFDEF